MRQMVILLQLRTKGCLSPYPSIIRRQSPRRGCLSACVATFALSQSTPWKSLSTTAEVRLSSCSKIYGNLRQNRERRFQYLLRIAQICLPGLMASEISVDSKSRKESRFQVSGVHNYDSMRLSRVTWLVVGCCARAWLGLAFHPGSVPSTGEGCGSRRWFSSESSRMSYYMYDNQHVGNIASITRSSRRTRRDRYASITAAMSSETGPRGDVPCDSRWERLGPCVADYQESRARGVSLFLSATLREVKQGSGQLPNIYVRANSRFGISVT